VRRQRLFVLFGTAEVIRMRRFLIGLLLLPALGVSEVHRVVNERNHHTFDRNHPVEARIRPGDRVITKTVDSAGWDYQGMRRTKTHGNPLTGPFYVEGAQPGDALVVHLEKIRLNRNWAYTSYHIGGYALTDEYMENEKYPPLYEKAMVLGGPNNFLEGRRDLVPWVIDLEKNTVRMREPVSKKIKLEFAARPLLGCIGVPPAGDHAPRSGPTGNWGGNMDYKAVREGATVYIPVYHEGGFLMFGDGHAVQGDGEAVGSGVETSLDVEVVVDLKKNANLTTLRIENDDYLISIGNKSGDTLNQALKIATTDMVRWLVNEHGLEPWAAHQLIVFQVEYDVAAIAGTIGCKIPKRALANKP
jgi:acetamidase/formamidase